MKLPLSIRIILIGLGVAMILALARLWLNEYRMIQRGQEVSLLAGAEVHERKISLRS